MLNGEGDIDIEAGGTQHSHHCSLRDVFMFKGGRIQPCVALLGQSQC